MELVWAASDHHILIYDVSDYFYENEYLCEIITKCNILKYGYKDFMQAVKSINAQFQAWH